MQRTLSGKLIFMTLLAGSLYGCGSGISGKYSGSTMMMKITLDFRSGNEVMVESMGVKSKGTYEVQGNEVTVTANGQNMVLTKSGDSLTGGPLGLTFKKE